jgi:hypothetical protein
MLGFLNQLKQDIHQSVVKLNCTDVLSYSSTGKSSKIKKQVGLDAYQSKLI